MPGMLGRFPSGFPPAVGFLLTSVLTPGMLGRLPPGFLPAVGFLLPSVLRRLRWNYHNIIRVSDCCQLICLQHSGITPLPDLSWYEHNLENTNIIRVSDCCQLICLQHSGITPLPDLSWYEYNLENTNIVRVFPVSSAAKSTDSIGKERILLVFVSVF